MQADFYEEYSGTNESEQGSESKPELNDLDQDLNTEFTDHQPKIIEESKTPLTSKTHSLEQSERKSELGQGKNKCCCSIF